MQTMTAYPELSIRPSSGMYPGSDRSLWIISAAVVAMHLALIVWSASLYSPVQPTFKIPQKFVVKTITLGDNPAPPKQMPLAPEPALPEPIAYVEEVPAEPPAEPQTAAPASRSDAESPAGSQAEPLPSSEEKPRLKEEIAPSKEIKQPPKPKPAAKAKPETPRKQAPSKKETIAKTKPKPAPAKQTSGKVKPAPKKAAEAAKPDVKAAAVKARQRELLAKAQESIGKIQRNSVKISASKNSAAALAAMPGPIQGLHIDAAESGSGEFLSAAELGYKDELASRLRLFLKLPEYGDVKIKLTLERSGKVAKLAIVSSESADNRKYVEKTVPSLAFPGFGSYFPGQAQYTFAITLSNDI